MKTGLEKLYLEALVGSANVEETLAGRKFGKEEAQKTEAETKKSKTETNKSNTETKKTNTESKKTNTESKKTNTESKKTMEETNVRRKGDLPDSIKDYIEHVRDNPEEVIDLIITTLSDYDIVI